MKKLLISALVSSGILTACSSIPMITDLDVLKHKNRGDLLAFHSELKNDLVLAQTDGDEDVLENRKVYIDKVGRKIAEEKEQAVLESLEREYQKHSIARLQEALNSAKEIEGYSKPVYIDLKNDIEQAITQKRGVITAKEADFHELSDVDAPKKVAILDEIVTIYGGAEGEQVKNQRKAYIDGLFTSAQNSLATKRHEDVLMYLNNIEKIDPNYPGLADMHNKLIASEYEGQFWDAVENGNADKVYSTFYRLTQIPNYISTHPEVAESADVIAQYFVEEGDKLIKNKAIDSAYQFYSRARYMNNIMGKGGFYTPGEKTFIDSVDTRLKDFAAKSITAPAYGLLSILEELSPAHPDVVKYKQSLNDAMLDDATFKIIPAGFSGADANSSIGIGVVSKINQELLKKLPKRVHVIDSSVVATDYRSAQIVTKANPSSYLFLSGEIIDAKVTEQKNDTSVTKRVVTGATKIPNPDYKAWTEDDDKDEIPQPPMFLDKPVEEDVTINKTVIEKQGLFSITYRLADAVSASVVFTDSLNKKEVATGENSQGVEVGKFVEKAKVADLPTNETIMAKLSTDVAEEVASKIAEKILSLEKSYGTKADQAAVLEDFNAAAANFGYSDALMQSEGKSDIEIKTKMRTYALRWK